jgi:uncharacterized membrane protein
MDDFTSIIAFFLVCVVLVFSWSHLRLRRRIGEQEERLAALTRRVYLLENPAIPPPSTDEAEESIVSVEQHESEPLSPSPVISPTRTREDWETVVGGNWLNRIGALVLVVGIALFLGYSLTQLGPAGKVAIGFAVGIAMLASGVSLSSSERYGNFAVSLVGGGWAAIYFTAYASHALEPARIVTNATAGAALLLGISALMIVHALANNSERGAALAFLFSFVSLNVSPLTGFSVYATLLLAVSTAALAYLRNWFRLALTGVILAYATFLVREGAPSDLAPIALWAQWFAFEIYDILDIRRRGLRRGIEQSLFLVNACGFTGASLIYRWNDIGWFLFISAAAYLASAAIRMRFGTGEASSSTRLLGGGYEGAIAASSALMAGALVDRFSGATITLALAIEGEMIVLAGHALQNAIVRNTGGAVLGLAFFRLLFVDITSANRSREWTPVAGVMALILGANRLRGGWGYAAGAGILVTLVIHEEVRRDWAPFALGLIGIFALWTGLRLQLRDVRWQHPLWAVSTFLFGVEAVGYPSTYALPIALAAFTSYACEFLVRGSTAEFKWERHAGAFYSILGTLLFTILLFDKVQGRLLTVALGAQGIGLLVAGMFASERVLRISGLALFLVCIGKAFIHDLRQLDTLSRILSFIVLGLLLLGASWIYTRFRDRVRRLL